MMRQPPRGRGTGVDPANRFTGVVAEPSPEDEGPEAPLATTEFLPDASKSIVSYNDSPDLGYNRSVNPYRGCEHGCVYCYARPTHEYLGFSCGLDFERKILVKHHAAELLRAEMNSPRWEPELVVLSGATDCYQPVERKLRLTRACLEVFADFRNPVVVTTKNALVERETDLLLRLAEHDAVQVTFSINSLDAGLSRILEPRTSVPARRLAAMASLAAAGVPVGVSLAPVIPGLTDEWIPRVVEAAAEAGASYAFYSVMRLPYALKELFADWLETHFPDRRNKVLNRTRCIRGGQLSDSRFFARFRGEGPFSEQIRDMFRLACRRAGLPRELPPLSTAAFRRPGRQMRLF